MCVWGGGGRNKFIKGNVEVAYMDGLLTSCSYNPRQKSAGQHCNIHIFLPFLGFLLKQCILFEIFLQFFLPPPYTKLKLGKNSGYTRSKLLWGEGRGWTCVNWKTFQKCKSVPRLLSMIVGP